MPSEDLEREKNLIIQDSLSSKLSWALSAKTDSIEKFNEKSEKWHTLNTLLALNNHKKMMRLESALEMERARLRFIEDRSSITEAKLNQVNNALNQASKKLASFHKSFTTMAVLMKLILHHRKASTTQSPLDKILDAIKSVPIRELMVQNGATLAASLLVSKVLWLDSIIGALSKLLLFTQMSKKSIERTRLGVKIAVISFIFVLLRRRIKEFLGKANIWLRLLGLVQ